MYQYSKNIYKNVIYEYSIMDFNNILIEKCENGFLIMKTIYGKNLLGGDTIKRFDVHIATDTKQLLDVVKKISNDIKTEKEIREIQNKNKLQEVKDDDEDDDDDNY